MVAIALLVTGSATAAISRQDAFRLGKKGKSAPQILRKAFPGVTMSRMQEAPIRVMLADDQENAVVTGQSNLALTDGGNGAFTAVTLLAEHRYEIRRSGASFTVVDLDAPSTKYKLKGPVLVDSLQAPTGVRLAEPSTIDRRYRGVLRVQKGRAGLMTIVNALDVEEYLLELQERGFESEEPVMGGEYATTPVGDDRFEEGGEE